MPEVMNLKSDEALAMDWPAQHSRLASSFEAFANFVFRAYCPLTTEGQENLPEPPFLICSNHTSHLDSIMLMVASGLPFQKVGLIAAKDYFFDNSHRFYLHYMLNLVPIARGTGGRAVKDSVVACRSFLDSGGQTLIIYPEGTRSVNGQLGRFKQGAAMLAHALDLPIVPACVLGGHKTLPKGAYFLRPGKVFVRFGRSFKVSDWLPLYDESNERRRAFVAYREATAEIERQVRAMASAMQEEHDQQ